MAPQFFVDRLEGEDRQVTLSPEDSRHALRSLRLRVGDDVTLSDDCTWVARGRIIGDQEGRAMIEVLERTHVERGQPYLTVCMAPPKGARMSWAVQKLAEIGVWQLALLEAERNVRWWKADRTQRTVARLQTIAKEAAMQARQPFIMMVDDHDLEKTVDQAGDSTELTVMLTIGADQRLVDTLPAEVWSITLLVGPEGGFTDEEVELARRSGAHLASLGEGVLRTETAAVVGAALVLAHYGRLG
jgi:16S rRNA (uracil1498-N3)-methyltransferase